MATEIGIELQKVIPEEVSSALNLTAETPCALTLRDTFLDIIDHEMLYQVKDSGVPNLYPLFLSTAKKQPEIMIRLALLKDVTTKRYDLNGDIACTISHIDILRQSMPAILEISQSHPSDRMLRRVIYYSRWIQAVGVDAINEAEEDYHSIGMANPENSSELELFSFSTTNHCKPDLNIVSRWWLESVQPALLANSTKYLPI